MLFLVHTLGLHACANKPYKYPEEVCSENNFSSKCTPAPIIPCNSNKAKIAIGKGLQYMAYPLVIIGGVPLVGMMIVETPDVNFDNDVDDKDEEVIGLMVASVLIGLGMSKYGAYLEGETCE